MTTELMTERETLLMEHVQKITSEQESFFSSAKTVGNGLLAGANHRRNIGILLASLKEATTSDGRKVVQHGAWEEMFADRRSGKSCTTATFAFSYDTARRYIEFSRKHSEPITSLDQIIRDSKDMLIDAGEIKDPTRDNQSQKSLGDSCKWLSLVSRAWAEIDTIKGKIESWPEAQRFTLKEKLKPYVELYRTL